MAQTEKNPPAMKETGVRFLSWKDPPEKEVVTHSSILAWRIPWMESGAQPVGSYIRYLLTSSVGIESACNAGDPGWIPGSGRSPGEGIGYPLQYPWASLVAQLVKCLTLCHLMDNSLPGSSVHGSSQARILEWVAIASCTARRGA